MTDAKHKGQFSFLQGWLKQLETAQDQLELDVDGTGAGLWQRFVQLVEDAFNEVDVGADTDDDLAGVDANRGSGGDAPPRGPAPGSPAPGLGDRMVRSVDDVGGAHHLRRRLLGPTPGGG